MGFFYLSLVKIRIMTTVDKEVYPIGLFESPVMISKSQIEDWIDEIAQYPALLRNSIESLTESDLESSYREGTWTIRQLVHHIADSHTHAYIRFKWAKAHPGCVIKAYDEMAWSDFKDAKEAPIELSLVYIDMLYKRWVYFLKTLTEEDYQIFYIHPQGNQQKSLFFTLGQYVWHGNHHLAQIEQWKKSR